jgi:hypothetical protein
MKQKYFLIRAPEYLQICIKDEANILIEVVRTRYENVAVEIVKLLNSKFEPKEFPL